VQQGSLTAGKRPKAKQLSAVKTFYKELVCTWSEDFPESHQLIGVTSFVP